MKLLAKFFFVFVAICALVPAGKIQAADFTNASVTLSTSRPSPSSPLNSNVVSGDGVIPILNNGSHYLASDSAKIIHTSSGLVIGSNIPIASQSAALTSVYLNGTVGTSAGGGADVLFVPITAMHTITFIPTTTIPSGGKIVITFPGTSDNSASPSATTFAFNNLPSGAVKSNPSSGCNSVAVSAPTITCTTNASITSGTSVTIWVGCTAAGSSCTTQAPYLINPTKSNQTAGNADVWKVNLTTNDGVSTNLDSGFFSIGTIESVTVRANIDPSLTFTIAGIGNGTAVNNGNSTGCQQSELTNTGINATASDVNLGTLSNSPTSTNTTVGNISAQLVTVSTNSPNGYVLTATSSGHLSNAGTGFSLTDSTTPQAFPSNGANFYGFHACGLDTYNTDIGSTFWNTTASNTNCNSYNSGSAGNICKYGWPTPTGAIIVASDTTGPIGNSLLPGNGLTSVAYAAGADAGVPPGQYTTIVTYVATPAF